MATVRLKVKRWGNSIGLLIPKHVAMSAGLQVNTEVLASYRTNEFSVSSMPVYDLQNLLDEVKDNNLPQEDWHFWRPEQSLGIG